MSHPDPSHAHEHEPVEKSKARQPHAVHEEHGAASKGPSSASEINPNLASDIAYWSQELHIDGKKLHEAIRTHGTHVEKIRHALGK